MSSKKVSVKQTAKEQKEYVDFVARVGHGKLDDVDITHDGYPLSAKEAKFIDEYMLSGNLNKSLASAGLKLRDVAGKPYIEDEIKWRHEEIKKESIASSDEIMQYFTKVMRGEEKDQFGLDAPLGERTNAAKELARRVIDIEQLENATIPEVKVTLNWEGFDD